MDEQRLEAGSDWRADIGNGILNASIISLLLFISRYYLLYHLVVFLVSSVSIVSDWCIKELNMGKNSGKLIWPVWYEKVDVPLSLSTLFSTKTFVDLSEDSFFDAHIVQLVSRLKVTLAKLFSFELHREVLDTAPPSPPVDCLHEQPHLFLDYAPSDRFISKTLKHQLSESGIICMDPEALGEKGLRLIGDAAVARCDYAPHDTSNSTYSFTNAHTEENISLLSPKKIHAVERCWVFLLVLSSTDLSSLCPQV
jgi:hypothetical protein